MQDQTFFEFARLLPTTRRSGEYQRDRRDAQRVDGGPQASDLVRTVAISSLAQYARCQPNMMRVAQQRTCPGVNPRLGSIPILGTGWIRWSIVLFSISGLAFMFCLAPLHARLADLALLLMILKPSLPAL